MLNGKYLANDESQIEKDGDLFLAVSLPVLGGKGGFGSMLRAIGAQIEKTTNKEACRDLSGRRLRDVNAEKRIKNWIKRKAEQQKERERRRREKLERLTLDPKIEFKDDEYLAQKDIIPQKVDDAIGYMLKQKKRQPSATISRAGLVDDGQQPCSSSSGSATNSDAENQGQLADEGPSDPSEKLGGQSGDSSEEKGESNDKMGDRESKISQLSKLIKRKPKDEPVVVSKKKKVKLFLGDDLSSEEE